MVTGTVATFKNDAIHNFEKINLTYQYHKLNLVLHVDYYTKFYKEGFILPKGKYTLSGRFSVCCDGKNFKQANTSGFVRDIEIPADLEVHKIDSFWQDTLDSLSFLEQKSKAMQQKDSNGKLRIHLDFELFNENDLYMSSPILRLQTTAK